MHIKRAKTVSVILLVGSMGVAHAGWQDMLNSAVKTITENESTTEVASSLLGDSEVVAGLKEALANGVETAVKTLGKKDGFMGNSLVQIPLPDSLKLVEKTARTLGQGQYADDFIGTMNQAAEEAVPEAAELLGEAIRTMSVEDATKILNGPDDAATQYFRKVSGEQLSQRFKPIVEKATNEAGVTSAYKGLTANAGSLLGGFVSQESLDVDKYVTDKALDGLFKYIAIEEKQIRENPLARSTDLLKKVFAN
jgi:hypothetical protein